MRYIQQITEQLNKMSEEQKTEWILSQAKLCKESERQGFLQTLTGEKKVPYMPGKSEIEEFCRKVEDKEIYVEYETHYCEFDDDGRYMDDWKIWHNDPFRAMSFLNKIFLGCHDLLILGEHGTAADILDRVCRLGFEVVEAQDSEDFEVNGLFTVPDAAKEGLFSVQLTEIGMDWLRAVVGRADGRDNGCLARQVIDLLETAVCRDVHPHMLFQDELAEGRFSDEQRLVE